MTLIVGTFRHYVGKIVSKKDGKFEINYVTHRMNK